MIRSLKAACAIAALASAATAANPAEHASSTDRADILLKGGTIYPGDGEPFQGDVAIRGDRIIYAGPKAPGDARKVIDTTGLVVAPGFIDPHAHIDDALRSGDPAARLVLPFLTQGVTTAFIGVDGYGSPDVSVTLGLAKPASAPAAQGGIGQSRRDYGVNFAAYVGMGGVRERVIGSDDRTPTPDELVAMKALVSDAMCQGALGLSTGLFYAPQSYAGTAEVTALAKVAAAHGGIYDTHIRDESSYTVGLASAIDEALAIGRNTGIAVHIGHIKALGVDVWGQSASIIERIEVARQAGQIVHADQYPWAASGTGLSSALLPRWAQDGGRAALLERFDDKATMARMRPEIVDNLRRRGGAAALLVILGPAGFEGKTLETIAAETNVDPIDAAIAILRQGEAGVASFNQNEADIEAFMKRPWVVTSSDALLGHPRYYASFARKYSAYVKNRNVIDLRAFISQSTTVTARLFGLEGRGEIKAGAFADLAVFDPARFGPRADYAHPTLFSTGMRFVLVNGVLAIEDGEPTGAAGGVPLPRLPNAKLCKS